MAYTKQQLLGTNKDGSAPVRGPRTVHDVTEPLAHSGSVYDQSHTLDTSIARKGAAKKLLAVAVHSGMHSRSRDGTLMTGLDASQTAVIAGASRGDMKSGVPVPHVRGQRRRTDAKEVGPQTIDPARVLANTGYQGRSNDQGRKVLEDALTVGGRR